MCSYSTDINIYNMYIGLLIGAYRTFLLMNVKLILGHFDVYVFFGFIKLFFNI